MAAAIREVSATVYMSGKREGVSATTPYMSGNSEGISAVTSDMKGNGKKFQEARRFRAEKRRKVWKPFSM